MGASRNATILLEEGQRRTVRVTHVVDVPAGVTNGQVAGVFAGWHADSQPLPGWWVSLPAVTEVHDEQEEREEDGDDREP